MNGKQARNLRKIVKEEASNLEAVKYENVDHNERLVMVGTGIDGKPKYEVYKPVTVKMNNYCQRRIYQQLKRFHSQYYGR